jgi:hypothetical protein
MEAAQKETGDTAMSDGQVEVTRLTSVELLDAAIWREIGTLAVPPDTYFLTT